MSIFTSLWFWILVLGILLTIAGVIAWAVTGNADILVGILLGLGVGWIIGGLLIWIFGRSKKAPEVPGLPPTPTPGAVPPPPVGGIQPNPSMYQPNPSMYQPTQPTGMQPNPSMYQPSATAQGIPSATGSSFQSPQPSTGSSGMSASQQQLMQLLQSNPQLMSSYSGAKL